MKTNFLPRPCPCNLFHAVICYAAFAFLAGFSTVLEAETFVWEDYDDFSGSSLDTGKWGISYWDGGIAPIISNGQLLLAGKTRTSWNETVATARMLNTNPSAASLLSGGQAHSVLEFTESDDIYGIELFLRLPADVPQDCGVGIYAIDYAAMFAGNEQGSIRFDMDLWYGSGSPEVQVTWKNPVTGIEEQASALSVETNQDIKMAFVRKESTIEFFHNDLKIGQSPYQSMNETFIVRAVSETDSSFETYLDDVRILRKASTTWLDGTTLLLSSSEGTSETLVFANGSLSSTFVDPQEGTSVVSNLGYVLDRENEVRWKITLADGDVYTFDSSSGTGSLTDYENGQIDPSGSWNFTFGNANPRDWMWFDHYPWVYSNEEKDWLYFMPSGGTLMYFSNNHQSWRKFSQ